MDPDASLATFFERPVVIQDLQWNVGSALNIVFSPWDLWFRNPRVQNRLCNFRNFRGDLHVKFIINGNVFYWGTAMASYEPYTFNSEFVSVDPTYEGDLQSASQRPHIILDSTTSQGGQLDLPFFWHEDNLDMTAAGTNKPFPDMGDIWLTSLQNLDNTQSTNQLAITVYAWMTNVKLSGPTQVNPEGLAPQSDEFTDGGPISKPAAILSKVAGKLETTPVIGKYAMATKMAADTIGAVAKTMGYSRPLEISNPQKYKNTQAGDLATTDSVDTSMPLSFSSKQEVTIDPSTTGLSNVDELAFKHLYQKESFITSAPWTVNTTTGAKNKLIFSAPVTPMWTFAAARTLPPTIVGRNITPAGYVALPFKYWKGRMKVRFQFVGSAFHKGRVRLSWDPAVGTAVVEDNTVFNQVIDISEKRDFSMIIGWGSNKPALEVGGAPAVTNYSKSVDQVAPTNLLLHNGALKLSIVNPLVPPATTTTDAFFNVFMSFEDLEVFSPDSDAFQLYTYLPVTPPEPPPEAELEEQSDMMVSPSGDPGGAPVINELGGKKQLTPLHLCMEIQLLLFVKS